MANSKQSEGAAQAPAPTSRRKPLVWGLGIAVLLAVLGSLFLVTRQPGSAAQAPVGLHIGDRAPNFTLADLHGRQVSLRQYLGRPVLLHFWAVDCTSCQAEQADYLRAVQHLGSRAPVILAEDAWGEPASYARPYVRQHHLPGVVLIDTSRAVFDGLYQGQGTPTAYYIDSQGIIRHTVIGPEVYGDILANMKTIGV